ncbi:hypothetical protein A6U85_29430 [Agrobacterium sp. 13-626]|nr:hypothetical protein CN09_16560 [Rhizobium rhizogenes]OCJ03315.1 hypothetical protein A6U85_29430 [Agrobacterium sp. 13-626]OCJ19995.1 hypothetical protein A6U88_32310 [Agrobacterium sp. B131/95]OCJ26566.1 hypothetical protein A6U89_06505 [Agrobacterium sp. B133/95]
MPLLHNGKYRIQNSLNLIRYLGNPKPGDVIALMFEKCRALGIITPCRIFRVLAAVEFDNQTYLVAGEISEIAPNRNLASKMRAFDGDAPQMLPSFVSASVEPARRRRLFAILKRSSLEGFLA